MRITGIYDFFSRHRKFRGLSLAAVTILLLSLSLSLHFSEDVSDFLPLGTSEREHLDIYQNISGADRIVLLFSNPGNDDIVIDAIDCFVDTLQAFDVHNWCDDLTYLFNTADFLQVSDFVYANIPYFLKEPDYQRIDSLLSDPHYVREQLLRDKQMLMMPASSFASSAVAYDPLSLFSPVMKRLGSSNGQLNFEMEGGYIFTPDRSRGIVMMKSPFGSSETENNSRLIGMLTDVSSAVRLLYPEVDIDIIGGPAIAVGNSARIKTDSVLAIAVSAILIIILLALSFGSVRNIMLIFLSIGWGLVFALGGLALFSDKVSIIVIGISSVILGIAVNYPLHLIAHTSHQPDIRETLKEIISPLTVGNITTVGAFLALVPLKSTALRDLGLFASLLLIGTMLFVILYLPHYVGIKPRKEFRFKLFDTLSGIRLEKYGAVVAGVALITVILSFFSFSTGFDSNMSNINYMTESQKADMQYFEDLLTNDGEHSAVSLYAYSSGKSFDDALAAGTALSAVVDSLVDRGLVCRQNEASSFLTSKDVQMQRIDRWKKFIAEHSQALTECFGIAREVGFSEMAFGGFKTVIENTGNLKPVSFEHFAPLTSTVFSGNATTTGDSRFYFIDALNVAPAQLDTVKAALGQDCFDVARMNEALTGSLSDNFNYIGWACSLIVFLFLWFSFGRIELAIISFLPMAISWIWILGLMSLLGIKFNIVNVILATFIFGQGDDYTIFMTEGCQYEYSRGRPILASYKNGILESAAIMFIGIGTLILAGHPALRSLAEVTIIGMFSVVLMAYLIPPLLFNWLTADKGGKRRLPVTLRNVISGNPEDEVSIVRNRYAYRGKDIERQVRKSLSSGALSALELDLSGRSAYEYTDRGYGESALLLAICNPDVEIVVHFDNDEHRRIAEVAFEGFADNIEIK